MSRAHAEQSAGTRQYNEFIEGIRPLVQDGAFKGLDSVVTDYLDNSQATEFGSGVSVIVPDDYDPHDGPLVLMRPDTDTRGYNTNAISQHAIRLLEKDPRTGEAGKKINYTLSGGTAPAARAEDTFKVVRLKVHPNDDKKVSILTPLFRFQTPPSGDPAVDAVTFAHSGVLWSSYVNVQDDKGPLTRDEHQQETLHAYQAACKAANVVMKNLGITKYLPEAQKLATRYPTLSIHEFFPRAQSEVTKALDKDMNLHPIFAALTLGAVIIDRYADRSSDGVSPQVWAGFRKLRWA